MSEPMFTKQHYQAIADTTKHRTPEAQAEQDAESADADTVFAGGQNYRGEFLTMCDLVYLFEADNPRFDRAKFEVACGYQAGVIERWIPSDDGDSRKEANHG